MNATDISEYDSAAEWCARRGGKGAIGEPLPEMLSASVAQEIADHPDEFGERVRATAYGIAMEKVGARKRTKFQTCGRHEWMKRETFSRRAEFFMEGGPADQHGCRNGICRIWPGTDLFVPSICHGEFALTWTKEVVPS